MLIALVKDGPPDLAYRADELLSFAVGPAPRTNHTATTCKAVRTAKRPGPTGEKERQDGGLVPRGCGSAALQPGAVGATWLRQCFNSLVQGDLALFKRTADAPFHMIGEPVYAKRDDLDRLFNENPLGVRTGPFDPLLLGATPLPEFAQANPGAAIAPEEKAFVSSFKPGELMVFLVQQQQVGAPNPADPSQGNLFLVAPHRRAAVRHRDQSESSAGQIPVLLSAERGHADRCDMKTVRVAFSCAVLHPGHKIVHMRVRVRFELQRVVGLRVLDDLLRSREALDEAARVSSLSMMRSRPASISSTGSASADRRSADKGREGRSQIESGPSLDAATAGPRAGTPATSPSP